MEEVLLSILIYSFKIGFLAIILGFIIVGVYHVLKILIESL